MMGAARLWLLSILSVSLVCALADALMPPGAVRRVGRMVCGLVLMSAILSPLVDLDLEGGSRWLEDYLAAVEQRETELEKQVDEGRKAIIAERYEAYILDKAAQLGLSCTVEVECRTEENGVCLPERVRITGALSAQEKVQLAELLEEELGVAPEEQIYIEEESP